MGSDDQVLAFTKKHRGQMNPAKPKTSAHVGIQNGKPNPVFIAGIKYESLFDAGFYSFTPSYVSLCKALKRSNGEPCKVKRNIVVLESWVNNRILYAKAVFA